MRAPTQVEIGRLALRSEGQWWNAYYARSQTMEGALHLGSVRLQAAALNPKVRAAFMAMMQLVVSDIINEATGQRPSWNAPKTAPERERSGDA